MQVILPDEGAAVDSVLSEGVLAAVSQGLRATAPSPLVALTLPRWSATTDTVLNDVLRQLGITSMFSDGLDAIAQDVAVGKVAQGATITVGERGTVAAATTQADLVPVGMPPTPTDVFTADRPFAYQIVDTSTSLPLFLGTVTDPSAG